MLHNNVDFSKKTILVTGGAGFIGSNLVFYIQDNFPTAEIVVFDCFRNEEKFSNGNLKSFGHYQNLAKYKGTIISGNINNPNDLSLLDEFKFDYIFHFAAISDTRVYDQEIIMRTNVNSFYWFLNKTIYDNASLVYASSAATYGNLPSPQKVGHEAPDNPYGYSKLVMDNIATQFILKNPNTNIVGLRFFNVYGPGEFYKQKTSSMIIQLGHQILNNSKPRLFYNSEKIFRDFVFIEDAIQAVVKSANPNISGIYNVGSGIPRSFKDIVDILQDIFSTSLQIDYFENPYTGYQVHTQADLSLSKKHLGFLPNFSLEDGIKKYKHNILSTLNIHV